MTTEQQPSLKDTVDSVNAEGRAHFMSKHNHEPALRCSGSCPEYRESEFNPKGIILSRKDTDALEMRVMSVGCTDADFRKLMDSHESLRNIVAYYTDRSQHA